MFGRFAMNNGIQRMIPTFQFSGVRGFATKYKMKTRKAVAKRFKVCASGHVKRGHCNARHLLTHKSASRKTNLRSPATITGKFKKNILAMLHG